MNLADGDKASFESRRPCSRRPDAYQSYNAAYHFDGQPYENHRPVLRPKFLLLHIGMGIIFVITIILDSAIASYHNAQREYRYAYPKQSHKSQTSK